MKVERLWEAVAEQHTAANWLTVTDSMLQLIELASDETD